MTDAAATPTTGRQPEPGITVAAVMTVTADYFSVSIEDLCGRRRTQALAQARHIAMYLCRKLTGLSLPKIGSAFGGRDHTTVLHADRKIRADIARQHRVRDQVHELSIRIAQHRAEATR